jgi:hypothetical protein
MLTENVSVCVGSIMVDVVFLQVANHLLAVLFFNGKLVADKGGQKNAQHNSTAREQQLSSSSEPFDGIHVVANFHNFRPFGHLRHC